LLAEAVVAAALGVQAHTVAVSVSRDGARPAAGALEARAHRRIRRRFERAGLDVRVQRFSTPRGRSHNVIGVRDGERRCVRVLMAHADTVPPSPGAEDNASGLGLLAALAPRLELLDPPCTVWLVATGAEERRVVEAAIIRP
jgi:aminopeptidase YwaD